MSAWRLQLLGSFALTRNDQAPEAPLGRFVQAMAACIALASQGRVSRERLASLIWEDRPDDQARHSLRQALLALRRHLGEDADEILRADGDHIALMSEHVAVDATEFEVATAGDDRQTLEQAVNLYRGELLEGVSLRGEAFGAWLASERRRFADLALDAMRRLALLQRDAGDHDAAIATLRRMQEIDPLRESALRQLMHAYVDSGRRADALREFQGFSEQLRRELKTSPEPETVALFEAIRHSGMEPPTDEVPIAAFDAAEAETGPVARANDHETPSASAPTSPDATSTPTGVAPRRLPYQKRKAWIAVSAIMLLVILAGGSAIFWSVLINRPGPVGGVMRTIRAGLLLADRPSIVVLPFDVRSNDPNDAMLADGIGEGITTGLSMVSEMLVIDWRSAMSYEDRSVLVESIADELGVRYCLIGSIQHHDQRVRITLQLVDAAIGSSIWAATYDRELKNVFELQDEITLQVITALQVEITEGEQERISLRHGTDNLQAWFLAGQGFKHLRRVTPRDTQMARGLYQSAIALDPGYPGAYEGLAWTYFLEVRFGWTMTPGTAVEEAARLAQKAFELDPQRARTHSLLGSLQLLMGNLSEAVAAGEQAIALDPNGAEDAALFAYTLTYAGDPERAVALVQTAMRLSPLYPDWYQWVLGRALRLNGDPDDAIEALLAGHADTVPSVPARVELAAAYAAEGSIVDAQLMARRVLELVPDFSALAWVRRTPYGDPAVTEEEIELLRRAGLPE